MLFSASAAKRAAITVVPQHPEIDPEPSLFRRKMEASNVVPSANGHTAMDGARGHAAGPNVRQYLFHLTADQRRLTEAEVRGAVVGVSPAEVERVARAVARLRGRYLAQVVDTGAAVQGPLTRGEVDQLRRARESYEEMEAGFAALRSAIEAGEIPLDGVRRD